MKLRHLIPCLLASVTLTGCGTSMTPAEREAKTAESAQVRSHFARKIKIVDNGGERIGYTAVELRNTPAGYVLTFYGGPDSRPLRTEAVKECDGNTGPRPNLLCTLYDPATLTAAIGFVEETEDTVITDHRLIRMHGPIKVNKGEVFIFVDHSPSEEMFAGKFVE